MLVQSFVALASNFLGTARKSGKGSSIIEFLDKRSVQKMWNRAGNNAIPHYSGISPELGMNHLGQMQNGIPAPIATYNNPLNPSGRRPVSLPQTHHQNFLPTISNNARLICNTVTPNNSMNSVPFANNNRFSSEWLTVQNQQSWSQPSTNTNITAFHYNSAPKNTWMNNAPFGQHASFSPSPKRIQYTQSHTSVAQHGFFSALPPTPQCLQSFTPSPAPKLRSGYYHHTEFLPPSTPQNFRSPGASGLQKQQRRRISTAGYSAPVNYAKQARGATAKHVQTRPGLSVALSAPPLEGDSGFRLPEMGSDGNTMVMDQAQQLISLKRRRIEVPGTQENPGQAASRQFQEDLHGYQVESHQQIQVEIQSQAVASLRIKDSSNSQVKESDQMRFKMVMEKEAMELENKYRANKMADNISHQIQLNPHMLRGREKPRRRKEVVAVMRSQKEEDYHAHLFYLIQANGKKMKEIQREQENSARSSQAIDLIESANSSSTTLVSGEEMVDQIWSTSQPSPNINSAQGSGQMVAGKGLADMEQPISPLGNAYIDDFEDLDDLFDQVKPISEKDLDDQLRGFFA